MQRDTNLDREHLLTDDEIRDAFKALKLDDVDVIKIDTSHEQEAYLDELNTNICDFLNKKLDQNHATKYFVLNVGGSHWIWMKAVFDKHNNNVQVHIEDSMSSSPGEDYTNPITNIFQSIQIRNNEKIQILSTITKGTGEQRDAWTCGYRAIAGVLKDYAIKNVLAEDIKNNVEAITTNNATSDKDKARLRDDIFKLVLEHRKKSIVRDTERYIAELKESLKNRESQVIGHASELARILETIEKASKLSKSILGKEMDFKEQVDKIHQCIIGNRDKLKTVINDAEAKSTTLDRIRLIKEIMSTTSVSDTVESRKPLTPVADELYRRASQLFLELPDDIFSLEKKTAEMEKLLLPFEDISTRLTLLVRLDVLNQSDKKHSETIIRQWLAVLKDCLEKNNDLCAFGIFNGLKACEKISSIIVDDPSYKEANEMLELSNVKKQANYFERIKKLKEGNKSFIPIIKPLSDDFGKARDNVNTGKIALVNPGLDKNDTRTTEEREKTLEAFKKVAEEKSDDNTALISHLKQNPGTSAKQDKVYLPLLENKAFVALFSDKNFFERIVINVEKKRKEKTTEAESLADKEAVIASADISDTWFNACKDEFEKEVTSIIKDLKTKITNLKYTIDQFKKNIAEFEAIYKYISLQQPPNKTLLDAMNIHKNTLSAHLKELSVFVAKEKNHLESLESYLHNFKTKFSTLKEDDYNELISLRKITLDEINITKSKIEKIAAAPTAIPTDNKEIKSQIQAIKGSQEYKNSEQFKSLQVTLGNIAQPASPVTQPTPTLKKSTPEAEKKGKKEKKDQKENKEPKKISVVGGDPTSPQLDISSPTQIRRPTPVTKLSDIIARTFTGERFEPLRDQLLQLNKTTDEIKALFKELLDEQEPTLTENELKNMLKMLKDKNKLYEMDDSTSIKLLALNHLLRSEKFGELMKKVKASNKALDTLQSKVQPDKKHVLNQLRAAIDSALKTNHVTEYRFTDLDKTRSILEDSSRSASKDALDHIHDAIGVVLAKGRESEQLLKDLYLEKYGEINDIIMQFIEKVDDKNKLDALLNIHDKYPTPDKVAVYYQKFYDEIMKHEDFAEIFYLQRATNWPREIAKKSAEVSNAELTKQSSVKLKSSPVSSDEEQQEQPVSTLRRSTEESEDELDDAGSDKEGSYSVDEPGHTYDETKDETTKEATAPLFVLPTPTEEQVKITNQMLRETDEKSREQFEQVEKRRLEKNIDDSELSRILEKKLPPSDVPMAPGGASPSLSTAPPKISAEDKLSLKIKEIVTSEKTFVQNMKAFVHVFQPLLDASNNELTPTQKKELGTLLAPFKKLAENQKLNALAASLKDEDAMEKLKQIITDKDIQDTIAKLGHIISEQEIKHTYQHAFEMFSDKTSQRFVSKFQLTHPDLHARLVSGYKSQGGSGYNSSFSDILIMPQQRYARYESLITEANSLTPDTHPLKKEISQLAIDAKQFAMDINDSLNIRDKKKMVQKESEKEIKMKDALNNIKNAFIQKLKDCVISISNIKKIDLSDLQLTKLFELIRTGQNYLSILDIGANYQQVTAIISELSDIISVIKNARNSYSGDKKKEIKEKLQTTKSELKKLVKQFAKDHKEQLDALQRLASTTPVSLTITRRLTKTFEDLAKTVDNLGTDLAPLLQTVAKVGSKRHQLSRQNSQALSALNTYVGKHREKAETPVNPKLEQLVTSLSDEQFEQLVAAVSQPTSMPENIMALSDSLNNAALAVCKAIEDKDDFAIGGNLETLEVAITNLKSSLPQIEGHEIDEDNIPILGIASKIQKIAQSPGSPDDIGQIRSELAEAKAISEIFYLTFNTQEEVLPLPERGAAAEPHYIFEEKDDSLKEMLRELEKPESDEEQAEIQELADSDLSLDDILNLPAKGKPAITTPQRDEQAATGKEVPSATILGKLLAANEALYNATLSIIAPRVDTQSFEENMSSLSKAIENLKTELTKASIDSNKDSLLRVARMAYAEAEDMNLKPVTDKEALDDVRDKAKELYFSELHIAKPTPDLALTDKLAGPEKREEKAPETHETKVIAESKIEDKPAAELGPIAGAHRTAPASHARLFDHDKKVDDTGGTAPMTTPLVIPADLQDMFKGLFKTAREVRASAEALNVQLDAFIRDVDGRLSKIKRGPNGLPL